MSDWIEIANRWHRRAIAAEERLTIDRLVEAMDFEWSSLWRETPIEDADGVHAMQVEFDRRAFAQAVLDRLNADVR